MAQSSDIKETLLTTSGAVWVMAGALSIVAASFAFSGWVDNRIVNNVGSYADKNIYPRIVTNERGIIENRRKIDQIKGMIESSDHSRNRQYGEIRSTQEEILKTLTNVRDLGIKK